MVAFGICTLLGTACGPVQRVTPPSPARRVLHSTLPLAEAWRRSGVCIARDNVRAFIGASRGHVWYLSSRTSPSIQTLEVIDSSTGSLAWSFGPLPQDDSFVSDGQRLYIAFDGYIQAFNLATGDVVWRSEPLPQHTGNLLFIRGATLEAYSDYQDLFTRRRQIIRTFAASSGQLLSEESFEANGEGWLSLTAPPLQIWSDSDSIWATDTQSESTVWSLAINECNRFDPTSPVQYGSSLLFTHCSPASLYAVDLPRGIITWTMPVQLLSNLVVNEGAVYAIDLARDLIAVRPDNGMELGRVAFIGAPLGESLSDAAYSVATDNGMIFAYFGDSQEVIAFWPEDGG